MPSVQISVWTYKKFGWGPEVGSLKIDLFWAVKDERNKTEQIREGVFTTVRGAQDKRTCVCGLVDILDGSVQNATFYVKFTLPVD